MSFGYSADDFLAVIALAKKVYGACKDGPGQYQEISREAKSVQYAIESLSEDAEDPNSLLNRKGLNRKGQFLEIISNCQCTLQEVQDLIEKHSSLQSNQAGRTRRLWDAYRVGICDLDSLRGQLTFHTSVIDSFLLSLQGPAMGRIEDKLERILSRLMRADAEMPRRQSISSVTSTFSILSQQIENDEDGAWESLKLELLAEGVSMSLVKANQDNIMGYIRTLFSENSAQDPLRETIDIGQPTRPSEPFELSSSIAFSDHRSGRLHHSIPYLAGEVFKVHDTITAEGGFKVTLIRYNIGQLAGLKSCAAVFDVCFSSTLNKAHRQGIVTLKAEYTGAEYVQLRLLRLLPQWIDGPPIKAEGSVSKPTSQKLISGVVNSIKRSSYQERGQTQVHDSAEWFMQGSRVLKPPAREGSYAGWVLKIAPNRDIGLPNVTVGAIWAISDQTSKKVLDIRVLISRSKQSFWNNDGYVYDAQATMSFKVPIDAEDGPTLPIDEQEIIREIAARYPDRPPNQI